MSSPAKDQPRDIGPQEAFTWPPKAPDSQAPEASVPIPVHLSSQMIESIETHLLGRIGLAFDRWAQQTGWTRDANDDYCWRCGTSVGKHETDGEGCATCRTKPLPWDRAIRLGRYDGPLRSEILALKFKCWRPTGHGLGVHLGKALKEQLNLAQITPNQAALVPIPMHRFRRVSRGIDHTLVLARAASKSTGCPVAPLLRTRLRPEQVGLPRTARAQNIKGAFSLNPRGHRQLAAARNTNRRVYVLIDDVRTTGATFVAAAKALKSALKAEKSINWDACAPPEIWVACIGVAGETRQVVTKAQK